MIVSGRELSLWRKQALQMTEDRAAKAKELDWLLQQVTDLNSLSLRLGSYQNLTQIKLAKSLTELSELWQQRLDNNLPLQYIVGSVFWRDLQLKVTPEVLIPRQETELIIEVAAEAFTNQTNSFQVRQHWVDLGTGSGAIALALGQQFPLATIHAVDYSHQALKIAQENAANLGLEERIQFYQGSWWSPLTHLKGQVRGMVSNPPYIPTDELNQLQPEVVKHEPSLALDGGVDGLAAIRYLIATAPDYLLPDGIWLIEMMAGQAATVANLLANNGNYHKIQIINDLAKIERFALAYRR